MLKEVIFSFLAFLLSQVQTSLLLLNLFYSLLYRIYTTLTPGLPKLEKKKLEVEVRVQRIGEWNMPHPLMGTGVS